MTVLKNLIGRLGRVESIMLPSLLSNNTNHLYLTSLTLAIMCLVCIYSNSKDMFVQYLNVSDEILVIRIFS